MSIMRLVVLFLGVLLFTQMAFAEVTVEKSDRGAIVKIDGELFTEYLTKAGTEPALYPLMAPTGKPVTRTYPFAAAEKDGTDDHPHHQSFWMTHGDVNGLDFWKANTNEGKGDAGPHIAHREFKKIESGDVGKIVTVNDWMNGDERLCADERTVTFGSDPDGSRWVDYTIEISAPDADVTFGDTKEGSFAVRVADSMRVEAKTGGTILNSEGEKNEAAWGRPARWVDYAGPVDGETVGIAIMSHPKSFRPVPRWHVRTYGLFAANPFGRHDFPNPEASKQGAVTIKKGDSITLRYRVWLHKGETDNERTEQAFRDFASN